MAGPGCPYLSHERAAFRESLDLSRPSPMSTVVTWYCEHPFHGIRLELGDTLAEVERRCGACTLPPAGRDRPQGAP